MVWLSSSASTPRPRLRVVERARADPVDIAQRHAPRGQRLAGPDHDAPRRRLEAHDIKRRRGRDAEAAPLADGEMDNAVVASEHAAGKIDDLARLGGAG